jgi:uncharacterized protein
VGFTNSNLDPSSTGKIQPMDVRAQALCLSGGGYRGLYTARILEHLQTLTTKPLHTHFRFIAGTSIGAIIAAALAAGVKPQRIREEIEAIGPKLFARRRFHRTRQLLFSAPYKQDVLSETLTQLFTEIGAPNLLETSIAKTHLAIIITATSASAHEPRIYGGNNLALHPPPDINLRDAILASSAAPTYFPARIAAGEKLIDGGLIANAPDVIALGILQRRLGARLTDCHILSIGTCAPTRTPDPPVPDKSGKLGWILKKRNIVDVTLDAQERLTIQIMSQLLKNQFLRIDSHASGEDGERLSTLDQATTETTALLKRLADERFRTLATDAQLRAFLPT